MPKFFFDRAFRSAGHGVDVDTWTKVMHVDISATNATVTGQEANSAASGAPLFLPSFDFGFSLRYPYLVGWSLDTHEIPGIRRIAIDRIFADGAGDFGL
jgi:hypothetical protein